jgi:DNA-binding NtrC family response regulator
MEKLLLVVDDDRDLLVALKTRLEMSGYRVDTAIDGLHALDTLAGRRTFDVMISGLNMPGMNGLELLARVRREYPDLPFILMSGHAPEARVTEALRLGAKRFMPKPFHYNELLAAIEDLPGDRP